MFLMQGVGASGLQMPEHLFKWKAGGYWAPPAYPLRSTTMWRGAMDAGKYQQTGEGIWVSQP